MGVKPRERRDEFPTLDQEINGRDIVYLDNAATTQKPKQVINRIGRFYHKENANVGRSQHNLAERATRAYEGARQTAASFIGADADEVIFVRNTTEALNFVATVLDIDGDIVVPQIAHHSNLLPWKQHVGETRVTTIPMQDYGVDLEKAADIIDDETAVVSAAGISNVFGSELPVQELADLAHAHDARMVVDGAQSTPRRPVDVNDLGADVYAFSGHKMCGPTGIGVLYVRRDLLAELDQYQTGGGIVNSVTDDRWKDVPGRFEAGTPHIAGAVGLDEAIKYLKSIGMENIYDHDTEQAALIADRLQELEDVTVFRPPDTFSLVSFTVDDVHPHDVAAILNDEGVAVRAGHHCAEPVMDQLGVPGTVRASPYLYNTDEDAERLANGVQKVIDTFNQ